VPPKNWFGAALLKDLAVIDIGEFFNRPGIDTETTNSTARRFYELEALAAFGFLPPRESIA
jgi:hypothetical protein